MTQFLSHHFYGHNKIHYTEMKELYISLSLRALALGVGGIFVPLYLFDLGYSLVMIAAFYIFSMSIRLPFEIVAGKLIGLIGTKHTLSISYISLFLHFLALYGMQYFSWLWIFAGTLLAIEMALFWISFHLQISDSRTIEKASRQISITLILKKFFVMFGPLIGGVTATVYGVETTLLLAAVFLMFASYPLFKTPDTKREKFRLRDINLRLGKDGIAHIVWQISGVVAVYLWPLWLLFILQSYNQIGLIITLSIMASIGFTFWVGKMGDKGYNDLLLKFGSLLKSLSHLVRVVSNSFGIAFIADTLNGIGDNFAQGPFAEKYYEASDKGKRFLYILQTNIITALGKLLSWVVLFILAITLSRLQAMQAMFIIAAITVPAIVWVSRRKM